MSLFNLRSWIQGISFLILTYGGRFGLRLGHFLPCFACPYVGSCSGHCYLMALQGSIWGAQIPWAHLISVRGLRALGMFAGFSFLVIIFSKTWCGWICPFGTLQDWISWVRRKLAVREAEFSESFRNALKPVKYILLVLLIIIPMFIANAGLHPDFKLPFCQLCPAKPLMPVFEGNFQHFAIDTTNTITFVMSALSMLLTAGFLVGMMFKDRFFCIFCPLLALISLFDRFGLLQLKKNIRSCTGCAHCEQICPMDISDVHREEQKEPVISQDCTLCLKCAEHCPEDKTLSLEFMKKPLFSSSRKYVARHSIKTKR